MFSIPWKWTNSCAVSAHSHTNIVISTLNIHLRTSSVQSAILLRSMDGRIKRSTVGIAPEMDRLGSAGWDDRPFFDAGQSGLKDGGEMLVAAVVDRERV